MHTRQRRWRLLDGFRKRLGCGGLPCPSRRLEVENLEERWLPSASSAFAALGPLQGTFYTDDSHRLFFQDSQTNQSIFTGAYAQQFSQGVDAQGNADVFFTDGNNQLWRYDQGAFSNTGGFALKLSAGEGMVAFTDGLNRLWTFSDASGFASTAAFVTNVLAATGNTSTFDTGWDVNGNNLVAFLDGNHQAWTYTPDTGTFTNTGGFGYAVWVDRDPQGLNRVNLIDGNGSLYYYEQGVFSSASNTAANTVQGNFFIGDNNRLYFSSSQSSVPIFTGAYAAQMSQGVDGQGNVDVYFTDGNSQLWRYDQGTFTNTGAITQDVRIAFGQQDISAGRGMVAFTDRSNRLWTFSDEAGLRDTGAQVTNALPGSGNTATFTTPPFFGTGADVNGNNLVAFLDNNHAVWTYNPGTNSFTNTGGFAYTLWIDRDDQGLNRINLVDSSGLLWFYDQGVFIDSGTFPGLNGSPVPVFS